MENKTEIKNVPEDIAIRTNRYDLPNMKNVATLDGCEIDPNITKLPENEVVDKVWEYWNKNHVNNDEVGTIQLSKNGIRKNNTHGNEPLKRIAYAAVPDVLKNGVVIDYDKDHCGENIDTVVIAAPVEIKIGNKTKRHYVGAVVKRVDVGSRNETQLFYLHKVFAEKKASTLFVSVANII